MPRFTAGLGSQEGRQGLVTLLARRVAPGTRLSAPSAAEPLDTATSSISLTGSPARRGDGAARSCSGSTPTRPRCGRGVASRPVAGESGDAGRARRAAAVARSTAALASRPPARLRGGQASARLLRAARRARAGRRSQDGRRGRARRRPARDRRRQARRRAAVTATAYAQALVGSHRRPVRRGRGPRRRRLHGQPAARPRRARAARRRRACGRRRLLRASCAPRTRAPPTSRTSRRRGAAHGRLAGDRHRARARPASAARPLRRRRGRRRDRAPSCSRSCASCMPRAIFLLPGVGAQGGQRRGARRRVRAAPGGRRSSSASRSIVNAHQQVGGDPAVAARDAAEELRQVAWQLSGGS